MSALDVAGAVVWTPLALMWWVGFFAMSVSEKNNGGQCTAALIGATSLSLGSAFCIARLFGAHL